MAIDGLWKFDDFPIQNGCFENNAICFQFSQRVSLPKDRDMAKFGRCSKLSGEVFRGEWHGMMRFPKYCPWICWIGIIPGRMITGYFQVNVLLWFNQIYTAFLDLKFTHRGLLWFMNLGLTHSAYDPCKGIIAYDCHQRDQSNHFARLELWRSTHFHWGQGKPKGRRFFVNPRSMCPISTTWPPFSQLFKGMNIHQLKG